MFHATRGRNRNTLLALRAEHHDAAEKMTRNAMELKKDFTGAELEQFNAHLAEIQVIDKELAKWGPVPDINAESANPGSMFGPSAEPGPTMLARTENGNRLPIFSKGESIAAYMRQQEPGSSEEGEVTLGDVCRAMAIGGGSPAVRNALSIGTDASGGYTVPVLTSGMLIDALRARSCMFQAGTQTLVLDGGKSTTIAAIVSDPVATWRAENAAVATSDMTFAPVTLTPKTLAVIVTASRELVEDSLNLDQALMISFAAAFAQELDRAALLGSGTGSEPKGVSKLSGIGSYAMGDNGAVVANYDPFVQALGVLRAANAQDPTACIINPRTDLEINLLKDLENRPLGRPKAIENLPFLVTSKLPIDEVRGSSSTACRALMGDFREAIIGIRAALRIEFLREAFAGNLQYGFLGYLRADVAVKHVASFCNIIGIN
jgi:HK97 family phage major capsid protein